MRIQMLVDDLMSIERVVGVGLGGSRAKGLANENSDYDLVLYRVGADPISADDIGQIIKPRVQKLIYPSKGNFLQAELAGAKIELFQADISALSHEIDMALQGKFRWVVRPLFPHGDLSTRQITQLVTNPILREHGEEVSSLRAKALPFPKSLKNSLVRFFLEQASYSMIHAAKVRSQGDVQYLVALVSSFVFFVNIVIFSLNGRYPIIEKGGERLLMGMSKLPTDYSNLSKSLFFAVLEGDWAGLKSKMSAVLKELESMANRELNH